MSGFTQPDPNVTNREDWTNAKLNYTAPDNASEEFRTNVTRLQELERTLAFHDAMKPNLTQTFSTPANAKTKIYFMWDFVDRTLAYVLMCPPTTSISAGNVPEGQLRQIWVDAQSRMAMACQLLENPQQLDMMMGGAASGNSAITDDIKEAVRALKRDVAPKPN